MTWPQRGVDAVITFPEPAEWGASAHVRLEEWDSGRTVHHCDYVRDESSWNLMFGTVSLFIRSRHQPVIDFSTGTATTT